MTTDLTNEIAMMKSDLETARRFRDQYEAELADIHQNLQIFTIYLTCLAYQFILRTLTATLLLVHV